MRFIIQGYLSAGVLAVSTLITGSALAFDFDSDRGDKRARYFHGNYGFTTDQTCTRSVPQAPGSVSIDPDTRQLLVDAEIVDMSGSGIISFTKKGVFTLTGKAAEYHKSKLAAGEMPIQDGFFPECVGTYALDDNNKVSVEFNCKIQVPAQNATIAAGPVFAEGYIARDGQSITLNLLQNIQTLTVSLPQTTLEFQRVCLQRFDLEKVDRPARQGDFQ